MFSRASSLCDLVMQVSPADLRRQSLGRHGLSSFKSQSHCCCRKSIFLKQPNRLEISRLLLLSSLSVC